MFIKHFALVSSPFHNVLTVSVRSESCEDVPAHCKGKCLMFFSKLAHSGESEGWCPFRGEKSNIKMIQTYHLLSLYSVHYMVQVSLPFTLPLSLSFRGVTEVGWLGGGVRGWEAQPAFPDEINSCLVKFSFFPSFLSFLLFFPSFLLFFNSFFFSHPFPPFFRRISRLFLRLYSLLFWLSILLKCK